MMVRLTAELRPIGGAQLLRWGLVALVLQLSMVELCLAQSCNRAGICHDYNPQPTPIARPETILLPSPNYNSRDYILGSVDSVVIHTTEGPLAGSLDILSDRDKAVSAHFVVAPNGDIYEMVDTRDRAWHATYYNSRSIGIEMVGYASQPSTWNENNLEALVDLLSWIVTAYPKIPLVHPGGNAYDFSDNRIDEAGLVAHDQVQPWNKSDPGTYFPWDNVIDEVAVRVATVPEPANAVLIATAGLALLSLRWVKSPRL